MKQEVFRASVAKVKGFTLIELLIVVAIMTLLATMGYGSYTGYIAKSHRQAAKNALYQIADRQEQFFQDNRTYAAQLTDLGYAADTMLLDPNGQMTGTSSTDTSYSLTFTATTANTFTVQSAPLHVQATRDQQCGSLTLTHTGDRAVTGTANDCW